MIINFIISILERLVGEKIKRDTVLLFAQSVLKLSRLWNSESEGDDSMHSVIVHGAGNYSIKDDIYISLPVKFAHGSFEFVKTFSINSQTASIIDEIVRDSIKRISNRYKEESFAKDTQELKLSIPHVLFE